MKQTVNLKEKTEIETKVRRKKEKIIEGRERRKGERGDTERKRGGALDHVRINS